MFEEVDIVQCFVDLCAPLPGREAPGPRAGNDDAAARFEFGRGRDEQRRSNANDTYPRPAWPHAYICGPTWWWRCSAACGHGRRSAPPASEPDARGHGCRDDAGQKAWARPTTT